MKDNHKKSLKSVVIIGGIGLLAYLLLGNQDGRLGGGGVEGGAQKKASVYIGPASEIDNNSQDVGESYSNSREESVTPPNYGPNYGSNYSPKIELYPNTPINFTPVREDGRGLIEELAIASGFYGGALGVTKVGEIFVKKGKPLTGLKKKVITGTGRVLKLATPVISWAFMLDFLTMPTSESYTKDPTGTGSSSFTAKELDEFARTGKISHETASAATEERYGNTWSESVGQVAPESKKAPTRSTPTRSTPTRSTPTKKEATGAGTKNDVYNPVTKTYGQGGGPMTPTRSTPTRSTPTRSTPTRSTPTRITPTRITPTKKEITSSSSGRVFS